MSSNDACASPTTATSNAVTMNVTVPCFVPQNITVSGLSSINSIFNGTYTPFGQLNGAPRWKKNDPYLGDLVLIWSSANSRWEFIIVIWGDVEFYSTSSASSANHLPCSGSWSSFHYGDIPSLVINGGCGNVSLPDPLPSVSISANSTSAGANITFTATPTNGGTSPSYQWRKNGNPVGTDSDTYTETFVAGDEITVELSNTPCTPALPVVSNTIIITNPFIFGVVNDACNNDGGIAITFDTTSAPLTAVRYIRVQQNKNDFLHLTELRAIEAFTGANVALNKSVTTESNYAGYPISNLVDGNLTNFSHSGSAGTNQFVEIDLGATYLLDRIEIINRFDAAQERADNLQLTLKGASGNTVHTRQIDAYQGQSGVFQTTWNVTDVSWADGATTLNRSNLAAGSYTLNYLDVSSIAQSSSFAVNAPTGNITPSVSIAASPSNSINAGESVTFTATPTDGGSAPTYQWKKNGNNVGTNSATYTDTTLANNDSITVEMVSNAPCAPTTAVTSDTITMTVTTPCFVPQNITISGPLTAFNGTYIPFGQANGAPRWVLQHNFYGNFYLMWIPANNTWGIVFGTAVVAYDSSATSITYLPCSGSWFSQYNAAPNMVLSGGCGNVSLLPLEPSVSIAASPSNSINAGESVTFTATPTDGGSTPTYQWKKNGNDVGTNSATYTDANLANNDAITVEMVSNDPCAPTTAVTSNTVTMTVSGVVPVEFLYFTGEATDNGNLLTWATATEENNAGFEVQKSTDGRFFEKIGFVIGNGTTYEQQTYEFLDKNTTNNATYYRLKQMDFDGKFEYSNIVSISNANAQVKEVVLYPNPVKDVLTIENAAGFATIYNALGQPVQQFEITDAVQMIEVNDLPKGVYTLQIRKTDGTAVVKQFVK